MKRCTKCGKIKSLDEFHLCASNKDGHKNICKDCILKDAKKYRNDNPERVKESSKTWRLANPEKIVEQNKRRGKKYNKSAMRYIAGWVKRNPQKKKQYSKKYADTHKDTVRRNCERRRARKRNILSTLDTAQWLWLLDVCGNKCLKCGATRGVKFDVLDCDHIIPLDPGTDTLDNVQPLCDQCNESKGRNIIDYRPEWIKELVVNKMKGLGLENAKIIMIDDKIALSAMQRRILIYLCRAEKPLSDYELAELIYMDKWNNCLPKQRSGFVGNVIDDCKQLEKHGYIQKSPNIPIRVGGHLRNKNLWTLIRMDMCEKLHILER